MYKVLIVDDDFIICAGLQKLIDWKQYGFEAKDYALNGLEAIEMIERSAYDLIITDIRMPKFDGIDLIKAMRERNYTSKIIILSGYRDFEYARTALEYGVKKYILKPVNEKVLISTITDIREEIDESNSQKLALNESKTILREKVLLELFKSEDKNLLIYRKLNNMGIDLKDKVFQVCIIEPAGKTSEDEEVLGSVMKKAVGEIIGRRNAGYTVDTGNNKIAVLFCLGGTTTVTAREICEEIFVYLEKSTRKLVNIAAGSVETEYRMIYNSFKNAESICIGGFFNETRHILFHEDLQNNNAIETIIRYVRENCCEKLTLQSIANKFFFNPAYVGRIFKLHTGMKFNDFLIECKLEKSIQLLENSKYKVSEIAEKVGYTDYDHFCKVFRSKKGCTPSEYKSKSRSK